MYLVISLLVLRAGFGIWLCQFLIIAYLFTLIYCFLTRRHRSIHDINKIGFIMISVSVHVTFESVKVMHLN